MRSCDEILEYCEQSTKGNWSIDSNDVLYAHDEVEDSYFEIIDGDGYIIKNQDRIFISRAHQDLPALAKRCKRLEDTLKHLLKMAECQPDLIPGLSNSNDLIKIQDLLTCLDTAMEALEKADNALKKWEEFEGKCILDGAVWNTRDGLPQMTQELYDEYVPEIQEQRNEALKNIEQAFKRIREGGE